MSALKRARTLARQIASPKPNLSAATHAAIAASVITNQYDQPDPGRVLGISTSHWSGQIDFQKAKARGVRFVFIKFMNAKRVVPFAEVNYRNAMDAGLLVSGYDWLYKASKYYSPGGAAREFAAFLRDHPCHIRPIVDYEWTAGGNPNGGDLNGYVVPFANAYGKRPMIYSARGYLDQYPLPSVFAEDPFWQARYAKGVALPCAPWFPKRGILYHFLQWTQTGDGQYFGFPRDGELACELNYWMGTYDELLAFCDNPPDPAPTPAPPPIVVTPPPETPPPDAPPPLEGSYFAKKAGYRRFWDGGACWHTLTLKRADFRAFVSFQGFRRQGVFTTSYITRRHRAAIGINGGGFDWIKQPRGYRVRCRGVAASDGRLWSKLRREESLYIDRAGRVTITPPRRARDIWNAINFTNRLVVDGRIVATGAPDIAPRTAFGVSRDGETYTLLVVDGNEAERTGATRMEIANYLADAGCWLAVNLDGGGSSTMAINEGGTTNVINTPSDDNVPGRERPVVNHLLFSLR